MTESKKEKLARMWWRAKLYCDQHIFGPMWSYHSGLSYAIELAIGKKEINKHKPK